MIVLFGLRFKLKNTLGKTLLSIVGVGRAYAAYLSAYFGLSLKTCLGDISREVLKGMSRKTNLDRPVLVSLRRQTHHALRFKIQLKTYQGIRYSEGLPVRGQNTKANARTSRMRRKSSLNVE